MHRPRTGSAGTSLLRRLLAARRQDLVVGATSGIVWMVASAAIPAVLSQAVDDGVVGGDRASLVRWCAALSAVAIAQAASGSVRHRTACRLYYGTTASLSAELTARVHDPVGGTDEAPGRLASLLTSDAPRVGTVADLCCRGSGAVAAVVGVGGAMVLMSPPLAALVLVAIPVFLAGVVPLLRPLERRATAEQRDRAELAAATEDVLDGLRVLHGLGAVGVALQRVRMRNDAARRSATTAASLIAGWDSMAVLVPGALLAVTLAGGSALLERGTLTIGELVAFLAYGQFLLTPVAVLVEVGDVWSRGLASAGRIAATLDAPARDDDAPHAAPAATTTVPLVELDEVSSHDGVLDGLTLKLAPGEVVGVACDATTRAALAQVLGRDVDAGSGAVAVARIDARSWSRDALRRTVLVAPGDGLLVDGSLLDNVVLGQEQLDLEAAEQAIADTSLADVTIRVGSSVDAPVGERGRWLSGGQRQRIGLARALATDPPVLVLVDPTSAVDAHTERRIAGRIAEVRGGRRTTVFLTTSPALLAAADRVVHVVDGRVAGEGTHDDLLLVSEYRDLVLPAVPEASAWR